MKVLVTCPPMLGMKEQFLPLFSSKGILVDTPEVVQTLSEAELIAMLPNYDGWIIGDDPATRKVFEAGKNGNLRAAVKWGIGVDNVDFDACNELGISINNTPNMFGAEVADIAVNYVVALARETFWVDRQVRMGNWPKPRGISLAGKIVGLVGYGDIGRNTGKRLIASDMNIIVYDPVCNEVNTSDINYEVWPNRVDECDFLVFTCSLTPSSYHMLNSDVLDLCKHGVRIVNVARGPLIDEAALIEALQEGRVYSAALDVFEEEPLPSDSPLREIDRCVFGSHNGSNTSDAVAATNTKAIKKLFDFLEVQ